MFPSADLLNEPPIVDPKTSAEYFSEPGMAVFDLVMLASTPYPDLSQFFGQDHDFLITGLCGTQTGVYTVQFILPNGRQLSTAQVNNANIIGTAQFPTPLWPAVRVPKGGRIGMNITETSGAGNTIQIVFNGLRLYRVR